MQETQGNSPQTSPDQHTPRAPSLPFSRPLVTYALLATLAVVYLIQLGLAQTYYPDQPLLNWGAMDFYSVLHGDYYRLFTAMFLHANDPLHIISNGIALWAFGRTIEGFFGHVRFSLIYFLGGLCSSVAGFIFSRGASVGASGAIMAIFGAEMVLLYVNRHLLDPQQTTRRLRSLGLYALLILGIGFYSNMVPGGINGIVIDNWGHIGGFVAGVILAWYIAPRYAYTPTLSPEIDPSTIRIVDTNPLANHLLAPAAFAVGLLAVFLIALNSLQGYG